MPRPRRSPEEIAQMRERMLDAALALLREGGLSAISIRALAEQIGVSHMVFYTYFESRADLLRSLARRQRERMGQRRAQLLEEAQRGDVVGVMRDSLAHYARIAQWSPRVYELLWVHRVEPAQEGFDEPEEVLSRHLEHLQDLADLGMSRGLFALRDPFVAAATAFSIANGPLILYHNGRLTNEAVRDQLVEEALTAAMSYLCGDRLSDRQPLGDEGWVASDAPLSNPPAE